MTKTRTLAIGLVGLALVTAACSSRPGTPPAATGPGLAEVAFLGDSIAEGEALPMTSAFRASDTGFTSLAAAGGGNVVGPFADQGWKTLPARLASAHPTVLVYQITTYDWGSQQQQQAAYRKLLTTVTGDGAKLVFVTMPPIRADDFYRPHMADLGHATAAARAVAAGSSGRAGVLDAGAVWGATYQQDKNGRADRSSDGIHTCPQGAARFTNWLLGRLHTLYPGFTPASARSWANTGWSANREFHGC